MPLDLAHIESPKKHIEYGVALTIALLALPFLRQTASVSFTCRAETLSRVAADLSKATGLTLAVSKTCANDVLLISAKEVEVDKLLSEIAKVDAGVWCNEGRIMQFTADAKARRAEEQTEFTRQSKIIRDEIVAEGALVPKGLGQAATTASTHSIQPDLTGLAPDDRKKVSDVLSGASAEEIVLDLLQRQDPGALILPRQGRVVFSTSPTRLQSPLPAGAKAIIDDLVATRNEASKLLKALSKKHKGRGSGDQRGGVPAIKPIPEYTKADLAVEDGDAPGNLNVQLTLYTADGTIAFHTRVFRLSTGPVDDGQTATRTNITPSEAALAFRKLFSAQVTGKSPMVGVPAAIIPYLEDPEHNDPLGLSPSDELLALGRTLGQPLVALVPDDAFSDATVDTADITLEEFSQSLIEGGQMTMSNDSGWIEITPTFPASDRKYRCDRAALGQLLRACVKESIPTLEEFAEFTAKADNANNALVQAYVATAVAGYGNSGLGTGNNWNLYRIFAELSAAQRAGLMSGAKLPLAALTADQSAGFADLAYGSLKRLSYGIAPAKLPAKFPSATALGDDRTRTAKLGALAPRRGYEREPTELLPNGAEEDGYIELKVVAEPFVSPNGPTTDPLTVLRVMGVAQMAARLAGSGQPDADADIMAFKSQKFKLGTRQLYQLTIHGSQRALVTGRLYDYHLDRDSPDLAIKDLPRDWRSELARRITALQQDQRDSDSAPPP